MHTLRKGQALNNKTTYKVSRSLVQHFVFKTEVYVFFYFCALYDVVFRYNK